MKELTAKEKAEKTVSVGIKEGKNSVKYITVKFSIDGKSATVYLSEQIVNWYDVDQPLKDFLQRINKASENMLEPRIAIYPERDYGDEKVTVYITGYRMATLEEYNKAEQALIENEEREQERKNIKLVSEIAKLKAAGFEVIYPTTE